MPTDVRVVLMTAPDAATAERLGATLVEERLATCANVLPALSSVYWWQGKVERASESLLLLKTVEARVPALRERAVRLHPYEVPELLVLEVADGFQPYLDWVRQESRPRGGTADEGGRTD